MEEYIEEFLADAKLDGRTASTITTYRQRLKVLARFMRGIDRALGDLSHEDILLFIRQSQQAGKKNQTIKVQLSTFYVFILWGRKKQLISSVPFSPDDYPKTGHQDRIKRLTDEELRTFMAFVDNLQENARAAFWLLYGTGARVGEVAKLTAVDVRLRNKAVYVNIKDAKWGSDRCIPITDRRAARIVWQYRQTVVVDKQPLFRLSKRTLQGYATKFAQETGIGFRCHLLRHTYAAKLTEQGVPITTIQYLLGHKTVAMTAYYAQSALVDVTDITPTI